MLTDLLNKARLASRRPRSGDSLLSGRLDLLPRLFSYRTRYICIKLCRFRSNKYYPKEYIMKIFCSPFAKTFLCLTFFCPAFFLCTFGEKTYNGYALFNIQAINESQINFLYHMWSKNDDDVDFWQQPENVDEHIEVLVAPHARSVLEKELDQRGIFYNVTNEDIQRAIEEELHRDTSNNVQRSSLIKNEHYFNFSQYNNWNDIERYLHKLPEMFPDLVQLEVIGQSHENRDLILVKISNPTIKRKKPAVWVDAGIHAREWLSTATILYVIDSILNYYEGDETIQRYLDNIDWYFLPMMNPDGYAFSHTKDRMWRKNRSPAICKARKCCQGVDLNRNFATQWGVSGASRNPCSEVYLGPKPFSEPESKAVRHFVEANADMLKAYFTFHSYGQLWLYPFGYKKRTYPEDVEELRKLSLKAVENIRAVHGTRYKVGTAANILYPSSGGADDWAKSEANIKYVFSIELRPTAGRGNGFVVHPRNIIPSGEETWAGIRAVADRILSTYGTDDDSTTTTPDYEETLSVTTTRKTKHATTVTTTLEPEEIENSTEEGQVVENQCIDLSTRCSQFDDNNAKCTNNVIKAICRKLCKQC